MRGAPPWPARPRSARARPVGLWLAALGLALAGSPSVGPARADEASDTAFWTSVRDSRDPEEIKAYLAAFPDGLYAPLARLRLGRLGRADAAPPAGVPTRSAASRPAARAPAARLAVTQGTWRAIDRIGVALDTRPLRDGSSWIVAVVPAGTPDAVDDADALAGLGTAVPPGLYRTSLPPGPPGQDEVRVYYIPSSSDRFEVAARAAVTVQPGTPGAVTAATLTGQAEALGPVRFQAAHADETLTVEGQVLRMETGRQTPGLLDFLQGIGAPSTYVALHVGQRGTGPDGARPDEVLCLMPSDDAGVLRRLATLEPGSGVLLRGAASNWSSYGSVQAVVLNPCGFAEQASP